jgi:uncharacterized protein
MDTAGISAASLATLDLDPAPIRREWILEGEPVARCRHWSEGSDRTTSAMVWDCTAGTFRWYFGGDEIVHIIEGEVIVWGEDGAERRLGPGDAALFRAGTWAKWHVPHYVRKHAICRDSLPALVTFPLRATRKVKRIVGAVADRMAHRAAPITADPNLTLGMMAAMVG